MNKYINRYTNDEEIAFFVKHNAEVRKLAVKDILHELKEILIINNEENTELFNYNFILEIINELAIKNGLDLRY